MYHRRVRKSPDVDFPVKLGCFPGVGIFPMLPQTVASLKAQRQVVTATDMMKSLSVSVTYPTHSRAVRKLKKFLKLLLYPVYHFQGRRLKIKKGKNIRMSKNTQKYT